MNLSTSELFIGQIARLRRIFTEDDVQQCNELTKDFNPIYQRNEDSWKNRYSQPIVPGMLVEGLVTQVITDKLPGRACVLLQKEMIYYHPVHAGDVITAELTIIDVNLERNWVTQKVTCFNQNGTEVIKGQVVLFVLSER
ncbi:MULTISPECIES: MaoC/PaaZ C-terminal domain-containing protein [Peribacillus]|uniref:MaoC/PaaZ C-terminal domain-containing protein n=1 Tax=Peribacillus TaxID=2675229 RepID=UPI00207A7619|nr:MaoC/PaaZ C-terminal domain-containing protein [Peribacillus asahii]USK68481.1 MaoC family dehydratase N-terminal domain-containing protein [Peribacillus asahii]